MKNKVFYIGFYNHKKIEKEKLFNFPAATNKMEYIISLLERLKIETMIINPSWTKENKFTKATFNKLNDNISLKTFFSIPWSNRIYKSLSSRLNKIQLFAYMLFCTRKNDTIILYHSIVYSNLFIMLKKIKKFNLILEVEEIYQDINFLTRSEMKSENKIFSISDKFIYSTELMKDRINNKKENITISGNYLIKNRYNDRFNDEKKHIVYAGIIDKQKKGAFEIFKIAKYFSNEYIFHILGFGDSQDISQLRENILIFNKNNAAKVEYNGLLFNEDLNIFLQKCDIGLSCQTPVGKYNNSSFPSKVINYLTNGIEVITIDLQVIRKSKINDIVSYYQENNYQEIYNIAKKINKNSDKILNKIKKIDEFNLKKIDELLGSCKQ